VPRPLANGAYLELFASAERDENLYGEQLLTWTDDFYKEKLTLFSNGYLYHPRLLLYQLSLSGAWKQEDYAATSGGPFARRTDSSLEYDAKLVFLAEHPYSLELFARRFEPLLKEQFSTQHNTVETSRGALARYRRKPYFFHASYIDQTIESNAASSAVERLGLEGEYHRELPSGNLLSFNAALAPSRFSNSAGLEGETTDSLVSNLLDFGRWRLSSALSHNAFDQGGAAASKFEHRQMTWHELLSVELPLDLRSDLSYRYQASDSSLPAAPGAAARKLSDRSRGLQLDVAHRLYESLDSRYAFLRDEQASAGGDTTSEAHSLSFGYTKRLPGHSRLLAGLSAGRSETESSGRTDVVNEPHPATFVPGAFLLGQDNPDPATVAVLLRSPVEPFETVRLEEDLHYLLTPSGATLEVRIFALPPRFAVPGTFDFLVSYSLAAGSFRLRSESLGWNASVELFDQRLTPYYSWVTVRSDVVAGAFPGVALDSTTYTTGLLLQRRPLRARLEYQKLDWEVAPYEAWKAELQVVGALGRSTSVHATAGYVAKDFPQGSSALFAEPYSETATSASGSLQQRLFSRRLVLSVGGSRTRIAGLIDTDAHTFNSTLSWRIGRLDLSAGASAYRAATEGPRVVTSRRAHEYYYLKLRRDFF
jgi:hypothetical protein